MANDDPRQEVEINLAGRIFRSRPTFKLLTQIETATGGQPARALGLRAMLMGMPIAERPPGIQEISLGEMAVVIFWMVRDQKDAPKTIDEVGEILMDEGYGQHCLDVGQFLMRGQRGNKEYLKDLERQAKEDAAKKAAAVRPTDDSPNSQTSG